MSRGIVEDEDVLQGGLLTATPVVFAFRLKLYHGTPRALLHPRFQDPVESKQQQDVASRSFLGGLSYPNEYRRVRRVNAMRGPCPGSAKQMCLAASREKPGWANPGFASLPTRAFMDNDFFDSGAAKLSPPLLVISACFLFFREQIPDGDGEEPPAIRPEAPPASGDDISPPSRKPSDVWAADHSRLAAGTRGCE